MRWGRQQSTCRFGKAWGIREVRDPRHARKQSAREPGDPATTQAGTLGSIEKSKDVGDDGRNRKSDRPKTGRSLRTTMGRRRKDRPCQRRSEWSKGGWPKETVAAKHEPAQDRVIVQSALERIRQAAVKDITGEVHQPDAPYLPPEVCCAKSFTNLSVMRLRE